MAWRSARWPGRLLLVDADQFRRVAELAGSYHEEAARCADAGAFHAACVMIGCAAEAALLATAAALEGDLRRQGR
jgi:hypothetical protein